MDSRQLRDLGPSFEARALNIADRVDIRGIEPRLSTHLPVAVSVGPTGCAMLFRSGAVVFFGVDPLAQERFIADLGPRLQGRYDNPETESARIQVGDNEAVDDVITIKESSVERLQVVAEILAKSVVLGRNEQEIGAVFLSIEPLAQQMKKSPRRLPWKQRDLVRYIGEAMYVEHQLVDRAEVLEKPELLWDRADLDRLYARLEDEYEIRERHAVLESKLSLVSNAARTMLELNQARRSLNVEYYIVGLILFEIMLTLGEKLF
ncbi:MAG: hypothetical protein JWP01_3458 [Myxococcales bacterium]|nr:hypothetical protein [Myxococcales bacterium]